MASFSPTKPAVQALRDGDEAKLAAWLDDGGDPAAYVNDGRVSLLMVAVITGTLPRAAPAHANEPLLRLLLARGVDASPLVCADGGVRRLGLPSACSAASSSTTATAPARLRHGLRRHLT